MVTALPGSKDVKAESIESRGETMQRTLSVAFVCSGGGPGVGWCSIHEYGSSIVQRLRVVQLQVALRMIMTWECRQSMSVQFVYRD